MPGIGARTRTRRTPVQRVTLGPAARAALRGMNAVRFGNIGEGQVVSLGPRARAYLKGKGVPVDHFPQRFKVVGSKRRL